MTAAAAVAAPAHRRRVGPRRRLLGDAGPPRRDPRRRPARRRARSPPPASPCPPAAAGWPVAGLAVIVLGGRRRGRAARARPTRAGCRCSPLASAARDRRAAGAARRCGGRWRRAARRARGDQLRRVPRTTGRSTSCSTAERTGLAARPLFALRIAVTLALAVVSYRLLERPIRAGRLRWRPACRRGRGRAAPSSPSSSPSCRSTRRRTGWLATAEADRGDAGAGRLGRRAACRVAADARRRRRPRRRRRRRRRPTTAAAPTTAATATADDRPRPCRRRRCPRPLPTGLSRPVRIIVVGDSTAVGDRRRDAGVGRRPPRRRPGQRAGGARLRVHPRRRRSPPTSDDGFRRDVRRRCGPSGSRQRCRHCAPTSSSGWSRCATSRTACGTTPRARSARPTTASSPASSRTTTPRRSRSWPPGPRTCCGCWRRCRRSRSTPTRRASLDPAALRALRGGDARGRRSAPRPGERRRPRRLVRRRAGRRRSGPTACTGHPRRREAIAADFLGPVAVDGGRVMTP